MGLGVVGSGVVEVLARHGELIARRTGVSLRVVRALVRKPRRRRVGHAAHVPLTTDPAAVLGAKDIDVVVELMGGIEPARAYVLRALRAGQPVVTANKALLAAHGPQVFRVSAATGSDIYFEAAVAGGVPIIRSLREAMISDRINEVVGILNGTSNYILDRMQSGADYAGALAEAQRLGYAEADPTLDVSGRDTADKLAILVQLAFGKVVRPAQIATIGITLMTRELQADAERLGYSVKLLGIARRHDNGLEVRVQPTLIPRRHSLSSVRGAHNAILLQSDALGEMLYQGLGAGSLPTGSAVVADLIEAGRNLRAGASLRVELRADARSPALLPRSAASCAHYLRLVVAERPGVLAAITHVLADAGVSLSAVFQDQHSGNGKQKVPVTLVTHACKMGQMDRALGRLRRLAALQGPVQRVAIEGELT